MDIIGTNTSNYKVDVNEDIKAGSNDTNGVILTSPNGTEYKITIDNDGNLITNQI